MSAYLHAASVSVEGSIGHATLQQAVPFGPKTTVTLKKSIRKGGEQANVFVRSVSGQSFDFDVPPNTSTFTMPDFTTGPVYVKFQ